jgi:DNA-binding winged helix-turn-helix (wHTH) protein/Tol biopolymer transport system component
VSSKELRKRGLRIRLSASQIRLLMLFLERPGELITREQIAQRIWTETNTIDVATGINTAINRLRGHLGDDPADPVFVETVIGLGYRFIAVIEEAVLESGGPESHATNLRSEVPSPSPEREVVAMAISLPAELQLSSATARPFRSSRGLWLTLSLAVCLAAAVVVGLYRHRMAAKPLLVQSPLLQWEPLTTDHDENKVTAEAVSPDGQMIAYADNFGLSVHMFDTGNERGLAPLPALEVHRIAWFPDGQHMLVSGVDIASHHTLVREVWLHSAYTLAAASDADLAAISPDGMNIAFTRAQGREVWVVSATAQGPRILFTGIAQQTMKFLLWSLDGRRLMIESQTEPLDHWLYESVDASTGKLLAQEENVRLDSAFLTPDGRLKYLSQGTSVPRILSVPLDPATGRFLTAPNVEADLSATQAKSLSASRDGQRIGLVLEREKPDIFLASLDLGRPDAPPTLKDIERLTYDAYDSYPHSWATDGSIFYETRIPSRETASIFARHPKEASARLIAQMPQNASMAQQSSDGHWVLFMAGPVGHPVGIYRVPMAGGKIEQVPTRGIIEEFHCPQIPTASCVLREIIGNRALVYYALDPVKGIGKELARTPWEPNRLGDWGLSPDGRTVISAGHDTLHPSLHRVDLDGSSNGVKSIPFHGPGSPLGVHWTRNGRALFVESRTDNGYDLIEFDLDGRSTVLHTSPMLIWAVPSPDGTKIAFPDATINSNVWSSNSHL